MVRILALAGVPKVRQDKMAFPSIKTVQAPHSPCYTNLGSSQTQSLSQDFDQGLLGADYQGVFFIRQALQSVS
jgi:hypothetical protein